jgi:tripartite-type tricarboxylate transporter receptor subunit TctC
MPPSTNADKTTFQPSIHRRGLLLAGAAAAAAGCPGLALAQAGRTVKIVVGFPAGQATDSVARLLTDKLRAQTGDTYVVENRPGTGGSLAMSQVAKAANDGTTMMLTHMSAVATNPHMYKNVGYDSTRDFEPVGLVGDLPFVLGVNASLPVQSVADLVKLAKAQPGSLSNASSGNGTVSHLAMEEFKRRAGINVMHVPYKGSSPGLTDVAAGSVSMALETAAAVRPMVESGRMRVLAVGSRQRLAGVYANVPTLAEVGFKDFYASTWLMLIYPAGTPKALVATTFNALDKVIKQSDTQQKMLAIGAIPRWNNSPEEAAGYVKSEVAYWAEVVKRSGVTLD